MLYRIFPGGVFTQRQDGRTFGLRRDKDIPTLLVRSAGALGFMGSDVYGELNGEVAEQIAFETVIDTPIRFALAAPAQTAAEVAEKVNGAGEVCIATSYPKETERIAESLGFCLKEIVELGGSVESAPEDDPSVDAIVDIVDSGRTIEDNDLVIVEDDLGTINIGAVWKAA